MKKQNTTITSQSKTPPCGGQAAPPARQRDCLPCEIGPFSRNSYYTGKLLTERDLTDEQRYQIDKLRLHQLGLHGWGVGCGLKVVPEPNCPAQYVKIEPGLAIDGAGREIYVRSCIRVELPKSQKPLTTPDPSPPEYPAPENYAPETYAAEGTTYADPSAPEPYSEAPKHCPDTSDLYVRLRYIECETEFTPAPFDECACNADGQKPSRIVEAYQVDVLETKPDDWDKIANSLDECVDDCEELYGQILYGCPKICWPEYIPLAVIRNYAPGATVAAAMIDNRCSRPLLPSTRRLDQLIRCILDKLPIRTTTRICEINWSHGSSYSCNDFHRLFVENTHGLQEFEVTFSAAVNASCLNPQVFQATVVRHHRGNEEEGFCQRVPAAVTASHDGTKFSLRIDKNYANGCLRGFGFDLFLTLRCDVVLDHWGVPVDGELLARLDGPTPVVKPPTGNGIPGGTFESWIRVQA